MRDFYCLFIKKSVWYVALGISARMFFVSPPYFVSAMQIVDAF